MSATILLVRQLTHEIIARSAVASETGFYWRAFKNETEIGDALQHERFDLIVADQRGQAGDPLEFVDKLRRHQAHAQVFLVCEQLDMKTVIRAIRAGVRDLFHPPLDFQGLVERMHSALPRRSGGDAGPRLEQWSELALFLADTSAPAAAQQHTASGGTAHAFANEVTARLAKVTRERDQLAQELRLGQERAVETAIECAKLQQEVARLAPLAQQLPKMEAASRQFAELKAGVLAQKERLAATEAAYQSELARLERELAARSGPQAKAMLRPLFAA